MALRLYIPEDFDLNTALLARPSQVEVIDPTTREGEERLEYAARRQERKIRNLTHRVKAGESLRKIAHRYQINVHNIRAENHLKRNGSIYPGLKLKIPKLSTPKPRGRAARSRAKREGKRHRVRKGDSLWKIAKRYGVSVKKLRRANRLRGRVRLKIGQVLKVP
jgi:membrane-bound lytic murein transglycosylase D